MRSIDVVDYDPAWQDVFADLRGRVWTVVGDFAVSIEHVGSTSVPGLAAKPIIDMSMVVQSGEDVPRAIERLATLGYVHLGDLGVPGREAFRTPAAWPRHHLYVCPAGSAGLRNHVAVRDYLRSHPDVARQYGALKKSLAMRFQDDIDGYTAGKTDFILSILRISGFTSDQLGAIEEVNRKPPAGSPS